MKTGFEKAAGGFMELASEQRLEILSKIQKEPVKISQIAKDLGATVPEVFRNFKRLVKADLISKNSDGTYSITAIGKIFYSQVSLIDFLSNNKKYFMEHNFDQLPSRYIKMIGGLEKGQFVKGFVKVQDIWKKISSDAEKYICNILFEVSYSQDIMEILVKKIDCGVKIQSIFSEQAIISNDRKQVLDKYGLKEMVQQGKIERRMKENVKTLVILNEKEACVMFPIAGGDVDMSQAFFSDDSEFHEWCHDYFQHCWQDASMFRENKLK